MGVITSQVDRRAFMDHLKLAKDMGWPYTRIAKQLRVPINDVHHMVMGLKPPSTQHVARLNALLKTAPPKRLFPPAPSQPLITYAPLHPENAEATITIPTGEPSINHPTETARESPSAKETSDMQTAAVHPVTNGAGTHHPIEKKNARYQLLSKSAAKELRRAMNAAFGEHFKNSIDDMAKALHVSTNGLRKILMKTEGSISLQTKQAFEEAIGHEVHLNAPLQKSAETGLRRTSLTTAELKTFRSELENEVAAHGRTEVAASMGIAPHTIGLILHGKGSSHQTLDKFHAYQERLSSQTKATRPSASKVEAVVASEAPQPTSKPTFGTPIDLYSMAGKLLSVGFPKQAHLLSMIALINETIPIERITSVLADLVPHASFG